MHIGIVTHIVFAMLHLCQQKGTPLENSGREGGVVGFSYRVEGWQQRNLLAKLRGEKGGPGGLGLRGGGGFRKEHAPVSAQRQSL